MIVYRIEHPRTKRGPYNTSDNFDTHWCYRSHDNSPKRPTPLKDFNAKDSIDFYENEDFVCGFKSIKQLTQWFRKIELNRIQDNGCKIYKMRIDGRSRILKGKKQLAFKKQYILKKEVINLL